MTATPFGILTPKRILLVGDLHANLAAGRAVVEHAYAVGANLIVQVGDFGFFPYDLRCRAYLAGMDRRLAELGQQLLFVDGNHDDHDALAGLPRDDDGLGVASSRIRHLPRGHRWNWDGTTWLALGGAPSVDKQWRTIGIDWWPREDVTYRQASEAVEAGPADVVVAHDSPWIDFGDLYRAYRQHIPAPERTGTGWPTEALVRADSHQKLMREVADGVAAKVWVNGHHHVRFTGQAGECRVESLGMDAQPLDHLCLLVDPAGNPIRRAAA